EMKDFWKLIEGSKEVRVALLSPATSFAEKANLIQAISVHAGFSDMVKKFFILLAKKGRLACLKDIYFAFEEVEIESEGGMMGELVSAEPLEESSIAGLSSSFSKKFGKKLKFRSAVNPQLLAG